MDLSCQVSFRGKMATEAKQSSTNGSDNRCINFKTSDFFNKH